MQDIRQTVRHFILDNFLPGEDPSNLTDDTELKESGILDSLSTLKLVSFLEEPVYEITPNEACASCNKTTHWP